MDGEVEGPTTAEGEGRVDVRDVTTDDVMGDEVEGTTTAEGDRRVGA